MKAPPNAITSAEDRSRIPDYELLRLIGQGSYGEVWLARGVTGLYRAVKIVRRDHFNDAGPFEREFRGLTEFAAISLRERIQLALLHIGRNDAAGFFYYVMEIADDAESGVAIEPARYVPLTLAELRARRGRLPAGECKTIGLELAQVLAGLHRHGLVHRDIKPSNIILVGGVPKLADIGLVTSTDNAARTAVGTEGYMPPEGPGSPAADVFALGKVLYELAMGLDRCQFPQLPPALGRFSDHRELMQLNAVILRACDPRPERRYADGVALLADLQRLQGGRRTRPKRRGVLLTVALAIAVVAAGAASLWWWRSTTDQLGISLPDPSSIAPEKSLVVLPLENLSPDPENAFFADGMHAEIISTLGRIPDLKVIGRITAAQIDARKTPLAEIGHQLGVGNVISGSVRRAAGRVRIQLELRRARDDELLWTQTYERELKDVLAIQSDVAGEVARVMQATFTSGEDAVRVLAKDPRAYDLFLKAVSIVQHQIGANRAEDFSKGISLLEQALALEPDFMPAAALLSDLHTEVRMDWENNSAKRQLHGLEAKRWGEKAAQLVPGGAGDGALAYYYYAVEEDCVRALNYAKRFLRARPNDSGAYQLVSIALGGLGRVGESQNWCRMASALDPYNLQCRLDLLLGASFLRRKAEWNQSWSDFRSVAARTGQAEHVRIAYGRFILTGELPASPEGIAGMDGCFRVSLLWWGRRFPEALTVIESELARPDLGDISRFEIQVQKCDILRRMGRRNEGAAAASEALALADQLKGIDEVDPSAVDGRLAIALVRVGRYEEAIAAGRRYVEATRAPAQQQRRWFREIELAAIYAAAGRPRESIALVGQLLRVPSSLTVSRLRVDPTWDSLRLDPEFQALLADPKNDAPL